jgi:hypothetical protein
MTTRNNETEPAAAVGEREYQSIRWLPVALIALILIPLNTGWIANSEMRTGVTEITISTLFIGVTFILFVLTLGNLLVRKLAGARVALNQAELMMLYSSLSMSSVVAGVGHLGFFVPFLANPFHFDAQNGWTSFLHLLPSYIGPRDPVILKGFYEGHSTFFQPAVIHAWIGPLVVWSVFFLIVLWTTLCLAVVVRRRWADEEHLPFPVIVLPLEMTRPAAPLYRNKLLWAGFAIPLVLHSINSLATIYPTIPSFPINSAKDLMGGAAFPWNGLSPMFGGIHPCGVGFGYLVNTDVLFSIWFFYLVRKALNLWGVMENWRDLNGGQFGDGATQFPFTSYQAYGAWLALGAAILFQGRSYFKGYFKRAFEGDPEGIERNEPISARVAVFGFLAGYLLLCAFIWSTGGSWWLPVAFFAIYVLIMVTLARLEAETAVLSPYLMWVDPQSILTTIGGTFGLAKMDAVHLGMMSWFNSDYRAAAMPHQLQGFVGQDRANGRMRPIVVALMLAAVVALVSALIWDLQLYYVNGAGTGNVNQWRISEGSRPWNNVAKWIGHPEAPKATALLNMLIGAGITGLLAYLRGRFLSFPLAPAAFVLNTSWANDLFWLDMLIAWGFKVAFLRYGGSKTYTAALPFFLGLILGDFVTGSFWSLVGMYMHLDLFRTFST